MAIFKKKEDQEAWERFKIKKKDYELQGKELKKLLIDYDDDHIDALKEFIPNLNKKEYLRIMIFAEEYEIYMAEIRQALNKFTEQYLEDDSKEK